MSSSSLFTMSLPLPHPHSVDLSSIPPSTLAVQTLEPIPGSAAPTPSICEPSAPPPPPEPGPSPQPPVGVAEEFHTPDEFPASRRSSVVSTTTTNIAIPGSYFPATIPAASSSTSSLQVLGDTHRPPKLAIPASTPDEPSFSAFPPHRSDSKGKSRAFAFPLRSAFTLSGPRRRERRAQQQQTDDSSADDEGGGGPGDSAGPSRQSPSPVHSTEMSSSDLSVNLIPLTIPGRRRAATVSHPPESPVSASSPSSPKQPHRTFRGFRRRRASISAPTRQAEFDPQPMVPHWPSMPFAEARRFDSDRTPPTLPFAYQQPADSGYTLHSVSTVATVRPLASTSPSISPRKSSLATALAVHAQSGGSAVLGLSDMPLSPTDGSVEIVIPDDMYMPHDPPPRRSSLDYGSHANAKSVLFELQPSTAPIPTPTSPTTEAPHASADVHSILSGSLEGTDTSASASADTYSSPSSNQHPLSSATTSLSRSAKSGKEENTNDEKDAALSAIRLQRSLEWEARQTRHRRRLEKRKMILLELVETEVAYAEDLKTLVQIYLPQLYALPSVSERTARLVARNANDLMCFHKVFAGRMVDVLKEEGLGYGPRHGTGDGEEEGNLGGQVERVARRLSALFVEEVAGFSAYNDFCAGSIAAATLVRHIALRPDYDAFERRCQHVSASQPHSTLPQLLADEPPHSFPSNRSRLHFRDYLITPIQRVCRYPLLLGQLLAAADPQDDADPTDLGEEYDVGVDVERALGAMRGVAEEADEARRLKEAEIKSATIVERMEPHPVLTHAFIRSLGTCRLIGSLDVLHHHPTVAPLHPAPAKVKYLAAFLYRGYLILAKVKKGKVYEPRHFLPLEVFELIDITEGFLPHSIRLSLRDHNFDLAASCQAEKEIWAAALCEARDESTVPPFELPASVSPFAARSRRSTMFPLDVVQHSNPMDMERKRHTLAGPLASMNEASGQASDFPMPPPRSPDPYEGLYNDSEALADLCESPGQTPSRPRPTSSATTPRQPRRRHGSDYSSYHSHHHASTILLRRATSTQRLVVDRALTDVFSESCATARSKAQLQHTLFFSNLPPQALSERRGSTNVGLRRRRSFLDAASAARSGGTGATVEIAWTGEVRGSVMPVRLRSGSASGSGSPLASRRSMSAVRGGRRQQDDAEDGGEEESSTEMDGGGGTGTVMSYNSDYNTSMTARPTGGINSVESSPRYRRPSLPPLHDVAPSSSTVVGGGMLSLNRRKTASSASLREESRLRHAHARAKSVPVSPAHTPSTERPPPLPFSSGGAVYALGSGLTNNAPPIPSRTPSTESGGGGAWGTLKRSMSFARSASSVSTDEVHASSSWMMGDDVAGGGRGGVMRSNSSGTTGTMSSWDEDEVLAGGGGGGGSGSREGTPRKRKSVKLFGSLRGLTPL